MTELDHVAGSPAEPPPPRVSDATKPAPGEKSAGRFGRFLNWFWRGKQLRQLRHDTASRSPEQHALAKQAALLFELGERAVHPSERLPVPGTAAAVELYRQSAYFAVRALEPEATATAPSADSPWQSLSTALQNRLAEAGTSPSELEALVERTTFTEPWSLNEEQRSLRAALMSRVARVLLDEVEWRARARDALWIQRLLRIGMLFVLVGGSVGLVHYARDRTEHADDLAYNKPWRASSTMSGVGCNSPIQKCADSPDFFFHTLEESAPWVEIDLGRPVRIGTVRIDNRRDCCFDRATPLLVEVSNDQQTFREVSRRAKSFTSWRATFPPTEARYVRVKSPARTMLHLSQIRVLP